MKLIPEHHKKLLNMGFQHTDDPLFSYTMKLNEHIELTLSTYPYNCLKLSMILPDGYIIVTDAKELDDIITIGKFFKNSSVDLPY